MKLFTKLRSILREQAYYIGFLFEDEINLPQENRFEAIHWLNLGRYKSGWFADPFFLSVTADSVELLVEEWEYSKKKGRLCRLVIERNEKDFYLKEVNPILELDTHLSFPINIQLNNKLYVYPENFESGALRIYEYDRNMDKLVKPATMLQEPLLDSQILRIDNAFYLFGVKYNSGSQSDTKKLFIYKSNNLTGEYTECQIIENQLCEERGAGLIFTKNGKYYRPAQSCEIEYGRNCIVYELSKNQDLFIEEEAQRIEPINGKKYGRGIHTINAMKDLYVLDGRDFRHSNIATIINFFRRK